MKCHEIDYKIVGDDLQYVEIELDPQETVIAEAGAMNWMDDSIQFEAKLGDGSNINQSGWTKILNAGKRLLAQESLFLTHFTNHGQGKKRVAFSAPYPGTIVPLDMQSIGGMFYCQKEAFLCAALGTKLDIAFQKKLGVGFFGGEGFILETIQGDGKAFIHAGGTVLKKELQGETVFVDTGCLVGFTAGINYDIQTASGLKTMVFGGEGLFLAKLQGYGTVYIQSLPFSRLANRILANAPSNLGKRTGEGSLLGSLGDMLDGR